MIFLSIPKTNQICLDAAIGGCLLACAMAASATSRMGEAVVRLDEGLPCFSISAKEERRRGPPLLGLLAVSDGSVKPATTVWWFALPRDGRIPISAATCIRYGKVPPGADGGIAPTLQIGKIYYVFLNARPHDQSDPTSGYDARFCLLATPGGGVKVEQIRFDKGWRDEVCAL